MFFKKKKDMSNNTNTGKQNADNLSQDEELDEALANQLKVDENIADDQLKEENDKIEKLESEISELKDKHLRLVAEFDNFRRRTAKERVDLIQTAGKDTIQSLLVVLDDMDRASKQLETKDIDLLKEGVSLVFNKFRNVMQQKGLRVMEAKNEEFNPDLHEAITEVPAPSPEMVGKILDVVEPGYYLNDKLIRHAKVVVAK